MPSIHDMFVYISLWNRAAAGSHTKICPSPFQKLFMLFPSVRWKNCNDVITPWLPLARNFLWHAISLCHTDWHRLDGMRKAD